MTPYELVVTTRLGFKFSTRPLLSAEELSRRIELASTITRRSLAVAGVPLVWAIQTDPAFGDELREMVRNGTLALGGPSTTVVVPRVASELDLDAVGALVAPDQRLLSVRIDSDDAFLPGVVRSLLRVARTAPAGALVDMPRGFLVDLSSGLVQHKTYLEQGPFYGVVTDGRAPLAAIGGHTKARVGQPSRVLWTRCWVQTINGSNDSSRMSPRRTIERARSMWREGRRPQVRTYRALGERLRALTDVLPPSRGLCAMARETAGVDP